MTVNALVTMLTDFGEEDGYTAIMKGVIACINPQSRVIDITHQIPPQNIAAARFCLMNAYSYFPTPTVHLAVVDPGVGSRRRGVAISIAEGYLVGPDNGVFSGVLSLSPALAAVELNNPEYWLTPAPSSTFHGRDIFAPVAAHLTRGVDLQSLGRTIELNTLVKLPLPELTEHQGMIIGAIQYIDHFGNLVTNIPAVKVRGKSWQAMIKNVTISQVTTYSDSKLGALLALIGSHGYLEIALNGGNAQERLAVNWGDKVEITTLS